MLPLLAVASAAEPGTADGPYAALWESAYAAEYWEMDVKIHAQNLATDPPPGVDMVPTDRLGCSIELLVADTGVPLDTRSEGCDPLLYPNARAIALRYQFYPPTKEGQKTAARFLFRVNFRHTDGAGPTDMVITEPTHFARWDRDAGYTPIDGATVTTRHAPALPASPTSARAHAAEDQVCRIHLRVSTKGRVERQMTERCGYDLRDAADTLLAAWRFDPVMVDGARTAASFDALVDYSGPTAAVTFAACRAP